MEDNAFSWWPPGVTGWIFRLPFRFDVFAALLSIHLLILNVLRVMERQDMSY
jgi:hypothetical protein